MAIETVVGLNVLDGESYRRYREAMTPLLHSIGGYFRYDFVIQQTLQNHSEHPINRLFILSFPDKKAKDAFFSNPQYLEIRKTYFEPAVKGITRIAEYQTSLPGE